jgi:hypothetical protein
MTNMSRAHNSQRVPPPLPTTTAILVSRARVGMTPQQRHKSANNRSNVGERGDGPLTLMGDIRERRPSGRPIESRPDPADATAAVKHHEWRPLLMINDWRRSVLVVLAANQVLPWRSCSLCRVWARRGSDDAIK